ncbi:related to NonF protein, involved in nonactin biosynthesis [Melanopsichium pennsylvanicum]|uniref:D-lactate dehydratase n=2 Tax=Melanopsichium pennsylvanicum TaxID=63383 RepID=A0AAJ4XHQ4_9BASI|nr:related to NonF protein, involved in nonactin biosynthesis [Melanopsichium pennsylvanicum 4]SNX81398.1 related to NonF protein, involved in nonactin biosynthesis [Melanopsichium pennsylvanicum]
MSKKILVVFTSHTQLIGSDHPTGYYLPEIAHPYYLLKNAGYTLVAASPKGGEAPLDQSSVEAFKNDEDSVKFLNDSEAQQWVSKTEPLSKFSASSVSEYDAIFYPGGHGPCFDLPVDSTSQELIKTFYEAGKPTAAVCHAPAVFTDVKLSDGSYLVKDKQVTCFTNEEEEQAGLTKAIPWLVESRLIERGAKFGKTQPWGEKVLVDKSNGKFLISGQNPASALGVGKEILNALKA